MVKWCTVRGTYLLRRAGDRSGNRDKPTARTHARDNNFYRFIECFFFFLTIF